MNRPLQQSGGRLSTIVAFPRARAGGRQVRTHIERDLSLSSLGRHWTKQREPSSWQVIAPKARLLRYGVRRFGKPEDLLGTVLWLLSPASDFVTGTVIPVDGGFSAYHGV